MVPTAYQTGSIAAQGAFTADFGLPGSLPVDQVPTIIERDRRYMAARPGMRQKHLPIRIDEASGTFLSGGRYLFDTVQEAQAYRDWIEQEFKLDGIPFFQRPIFLNPVYHVWHVIGAHDFKPIETAHTVVRYERWSMGAGGSEILQRRWPEIRDAAQAYGLASAWLLAHEHDAYAGLVLVGDRVQPADPQTPDVASLVALETMPSLGTAFEQDGAFTKVFDRTSWVFNIWLPRQVEEAAQATWPNSPPLPAPIPVEV